MQRMDSLTQATLGAAVAVGVMQRSTTVWKAASWGAVAGTLPDLDVLIDHGDPILNMVLHRAETHAVFWLTLFSLPLAWLVARLTGPQSLWKRWWLALWLVLITHPLLDAVTVYGTQLLLPFSDYPVAVGSVFIIDPLYTLPLVAGTAAATFWRTRDPARARRWNFAGLAASTMYLGWTAAAQTHVEGVVNRAVASSVLADRPVLVTPAPFNSLLWRVVVMDDDGYDEGYHSLLADGAPVEFEHHSSEPHLLRTLQDDWNVRRLAWFSKGFYSVTEAAHDTAAAQGSASTLGQVLGIVDTAQASVPGTTRGRRPIVMTDLRMGETPWFVFSFVVAERDGGRITAVPALQLPMKSLPPDALGRLWHRLTTRRP